ncbi:hypothetical protein Q9L58_001072 [Maublancomyces gigas]|uniref:Uncharacterized protein n=1 Tax=Discina gigas TaxID=1032678 RepID=A0ABR3GV23_9PEZI
MDTLDDPLQPRGWTPPKKAPQPEHNKLNLPLLDLPCPETDTLIYLSPISSPSPPLRCSSQKLLATGSPVLEKLLGPTCQFRLLRRKNLLKLGLPMGIKFVVDLSPPEEGDEAVEMIEKLWCPDEILLWKSNLEGYVEPDEEYLPQEQDTEIGLPSAPSCTPSAPSYSPTRHTAAIERVLHILHGLDPRIHTTPMWYTVHKVAVQLQCTSAVQDHILSWLYGNLDFIEHYPALVLRIAAEVQNQTLFRDSFALLVGMQLRSGQVSDAGISPPDDKVPEEAEPWQKNILFARRSLQSRLKRLHEYMLSAAWLNNATAIPEYAKLVSRLDDDIIPPHLKALTRDLDRAIRADIKLALPQLFKFSEDPGSLSYLPPHERQIYSRIYWEEMQRSSQQAPVFGDNVVTLLTGWEGATRRVAREERERELRIGPQARQMQSRGAVGLTGDTYGTPHRQSVLEVRERHDHENTKGKAKATPGLPRTRNYKLLSAALAIPGPKDLVKKFGSKPGGVNKNPLARPPAGTPEPSYRAATQLASINVPASLPPPPSYDDINNTLPCYFEHPFLQATLDVGLLSPLQGKRKSCGDPSPWLDDLRSSEPDEGSEEMDENPVGDRTDVRMYEMTTMCTLSRPERIEIINPISKRRCSVERFGSDEGDDAQASLETHVEQVDKTQIGEPEVFRISGVYDEALLDRQAQGEEFEGQGKVIRRTEKTMINVTQVARIDQEFQDAVDNVMTDSRLVPADVAAYWSVENGRAMQTQHENGKTKTTLLDTGATTGEEQQQEEILEYDAEAHNQPTLYTPSVQPLNWLSSADRANLETAGVGGSSNVQQRILQKTTNALGAFFGDTYTSPVTYHMLTTPCPYTSVPESSHVNKNQINTYVLWRQCLSHLKDLRAEILKIPISFAPDLGGGLLLVCLGDEEWQFMPLWAGGMDDGSGGVFGEFVAPPPPNREEDGTKIGLEQERGLGRGEETEVESLFGSYDDCMDSESMGSFETSGFSEFGNGGSVAEWSEFGDSEVDEGQSDVETREESEVESLRGGTTGDDDSGSDEEFEDFGWEST